MNKRRIGLALLVFVVSLLFHLLGINQAGRTWDEQFKVDLGYIAWINWARGNFSVGAWNLGIEHPMVAKYVYGLFLPPHLIRLSGTDPVKLRTDFSAEEMIKLSRHDYIPTQILGVWHAVDYDWTLVRLASALSNSLAVAGTFWLAGWFLSDYWALLAPVILLFSPRFLAMGKQVSYESITGGLTVTAVLLFAWLLRSRKRIWPYLAVGLVSGLLVFTRYNNVYVLVLLLGFRLIRNRSFEARLVLIPATALAFGYLTWPLLWHDLPKYFLASLAENQIRAIGPTLYYLKMLLVTTPVLWLVGLVLGVIVLVRQRSERAYWLLWWLGSVVLVFSFFGIESGGTRYIFFIYPAFGVAAAVGWASILKKLAWGKLAVGGLVLYGLWLSFSIHPYYLDYYNELIGGTAGAEKRGFEISWWGEGQREVGRHLNEVAREGASVALLVTPRYVAPPLRSDLRQSTFGVFDGEDYVIVSRADFSAHENILREKYDLIYEAKADGVELVSLWQRK